MSSLLVQKGRRPRVLGTDFFSNFFVRSRKYSETEKGCVSELNVCHVKNSLPLRTQRSRVAKRAYFPSFFFFFFFFPFFFFVGGWGGGCMCVCVCGGGGGGVMGPDYSVSATKSHMSAHSSSSSSSSSTTTFSVYRLFVDLVTMKTVWRYVFMFGDISET